MAEMSADRLPAAETRTTFFVWMAALCVLFAFGGFTPTYFAPMATGTLRELTLTAHIHGVSFFAWTLLLLLQSSLVAKGRRSLHRSLGFTGVSLATLMVVFGIIVNLATNGARVEAGDTDRGYAMGLVGLSAVLSFGVMFTLAIRNIARKDHHSRWMLFATTMILPAAVARLYLPLFDFQSPPTWLTLATVNLVPALCVIYDLRRHGRLHPATMVGLPVILTIQIAARVLDETTLWRASYDTLLQVSRM